MFDVAPFGACCGPWTVDSHAMRTANTLLATLFQKAYICTIVSSKSNLMNRFLPILPIVLVLATLTVLSACEEDDDHDHDHDHGHIHVSVLEPAAASTVPDCADVHIHVEAEAHDDGLVHDLEIELTRLSDDSLIWSYDEHAHSMTAGVEQDLDLCSLGSGTCFELEVNAAKDHDGTEFETETIEFCI